MNELGNKIKLWRNHRGLTLEQLNAITGIHYARLSKFERGVEIPNQQMLRKIEAALDVKFENLKAIDEEIEALIIEFIDTLFYMRMNFDYYIDIISKNREIYMVNQNYYKIVLIEYIINVLQNRLTDADKLDKFLDSTVESNTLYEQIYLEYKAVKEHSRRSFTSAFGYIKEALTISNHTKNKAMINFHYSMLHHDCGQYEKSREYLIQAKQIFVDGCSYKRVINCDIQLANIYTRMGYYNQALNLQKACIEVFEYMEVHELMKAITFRNTAWVCILKKDFNQALYYLEKSEKIEAKHGNLVLYKIWCYYSLRKYNTARKIIYENQYLNEVEEYKDRFKLFDLLVNQENQRVTKKLIEQAKKVFEDLAEQRRYGNMYFYLDILIDLLTKANCNDDLLHYLEIKINLLEINYDK